MKNCDFHGFKNLFISVTTLRKLAIDVSVDSEEIEKTVLRLSCPNLISFTYVGPEPKDFCFCSDELPILENAFIHFYQLRDERDAGYNLALKITKALSRVITLKLSNFPMELFYRALAGPEHSASFDNLKSLKVSIAVEIFSMEHLVTVLKSSPNLETLTILFDWWNGGEIEAWRMPVEGLACLTHQLRIIEVIGFEPTKNELELLRFLLKYGEVLEVIRISYSAALETLRNAIKMIKKFPRSSPSVRIKFAELVSGIDIGEWLEVTC